MSKEEVQQRLESIVARVKELSARPSELPSLHELKKDETVFRKWHLVAGGMFLALALLLGLAIYFQGSTLRNFARFWFYFEGIGETGEECVIEMPSKMREMFRPPVSCDMCEHIKQIDRVKDISQKDFEATYAYSGRPVVVTDSQVNWTASDTFSFEFFKGIYGNDSPVLRRYGNCQFFPYQTTFRSLREVFNMSEERRSMKSEPWYVGWSNCDPSVANILRQHYQRPYFLPEGAESSKIDWIFMGMPGYGAHMHVDMVKYPSWQAQIKGKKLWSLEPPPECYFKCVPLETIVSPGETIILDTNIWYHKTLIVSDELSITIGSEYD